MSSKDDNLFEPIESHNDEEMLKLAKDLNAYSIQGLIDLRNAYPNIPKELVPHENFFKSLVSATAIFLTEINNNNGNNQKTNQESGS